MEWREYTDAFVIASEVLTLCPTALQTPLDQKALAPGCVCFYLPILMGRRPGRHIIPPVMDIVS